MLKINIGDVFHRWTVIEFSDKLNSRNHKTCVAKCSCGTTRLVSLSDLRNNRSKSCGCIAKEKNSTRRTSHGYTKNPLYNRWHAIYRRCYHTSDSRYVYYGARGVKMCDEWKENPQSFFDWFASQTDDYSLTVDRIDTFGSYSPENCRLITLEAQQQNRRKRKGSLPDDIVLKIRKMLADEVAVKDISETLDVHRATIFAIKSDKQYRNVR